MSKKIASFVLLSVMCVAASFAQMGQVGAINGTVTIQEDGTALPGVSVTLRSPALILPSLSSITNTNGQFRFVNLSPGTYELTFELTGFAKTIRSGIVVNANATYSVNLALSPEKFAETVMVVGQAPTIDRQSVAKTTTLDKTFLASMPAGRDLNALLNMTPGVTGGSSQGATVRDNMYAVDGVQINDPSVGTITGNPLSIEIMEELSVQASGAGAEWGSVKGGVLNVVTKSGGNNFSGDAQFLYQGENWKSDNTQGTPFEGQKSGNKFWMEPSVSLGGPVIKDKLWFFANFTYRGFNRYVPGFPFDGAPVPLKDESFNPYVKFTFQPSGSDKFVAAISYQKQNQTPFSGDQYSNMDAVQDDPQTIIIPSLHWTHTWSSNFITNIKIGMLYYKWDWVPSTEKGRNTGYYEYTNYRSWNGSGMEDLYQRNRYQANVDGTVFLDDLAGSHEIKFGIQTNLNATSRTVNCFGPKDAGGLTQLYLNFWKGEPYYASWGAGFQQKARAINAGIFLDDTWNILKNLTVNLGLRFDYNENQTPAQKGTSDVPAAGNLAYLGMPDMTWNMDIQKTQSLYKWGTLSPRLGMIFDLTSDGKTLLKANFSQYLQDNYTSITWYASQVGWIWVQGWVNPDRTMSMVDGAWVPGSNVTLGYPGSKLSAPRTYEASIGVERELWEDVSAGLRYVRRWDRKLIEDVDASALDMDALMNKNQLIWDANRWTPIQYTDPVSNKTVTFYRDDNWKSPVLYMVNPPGLDRDYNAIEFTLRKRFSHGYSFDFSYVYSKSTGLVQNTYWESELDEPLFNDPNAHTNAAGSMYLERPHQLKLSGLARGPLGINISGYARFLSGNASRRMISSDQAGILYVGWNVPVAPYGDYRLPDMFLIDLRLEKELRIADSLTIRLFGDCFNLANTNTTTGWEEIGNNPSSPFHKITRIMDSRSFRVGAKFEF